MPDVPNPGALTAARILAVAEEVVRRHGPAKATVVDVAQALGVSHGSIYRFFPTKVALREAVVAVWLGRIESALTAQTARSAGQPALPRVEACLRKLWSLKKTQHADDPELFEAFRQLSADNPEPVRAYKARLEALLAGVIAEGIARGELAPAHPDTVARALLSATTRFSHPSFASFWNTPEADTDFNQLWAVLARGIQK